ncbi:DNA-binding LytR/AlgR family response regulator [Dyadobacter sp. BE34]|jgi:two-component system, LytTR family, response regulator LytT|uniref:DNA-binding LytR/AlgR family response regulator n=1 Tax=Dyadobacter fermentans TaxID=94254 RepID=A0ABU1R990_9BACT|nr:DNA-binding LytR/AlgR family response regulator [Dyadobacter fermentans]MDR7047248.1 DNA-binding LytR/AlgR family response regulator [Dyadobacter sp. BE242]MDR7201484.1 DNA-binding LytR/AlgR family response regulator [Dyadobacter sp. BE34]MDR7219354.1 DNA-binding LytR/AlgR family response regulator [Dyadobacter sp. BE31]MDR7267120.1 DNA-binding LytR/AlgR family response regulator [Dyadobacter sp. BE32]
MSITLECIAVDDEPLALGLVCAFIEKTPFLNLAGRYSSAVEALQVINSKPIDVIFLDIQMPDLTGIELARVLEKAGNKAPRIIFTTAFNQYALDGFRVDAIDYLLKPFNYEEFLRAASKAQAYVELVQKASSAGSAEPKDEYLFLKVEYQLVRIAYDDILYTEGLKDYVKVHLKSDPKPILSLTSLKALEEKLPASKFMRVHRSFIVNLDKISAVTRNTIQIGATSIPVSDQYKEAFNQFLSKWM